MLRVAPVRTGVEILGSESTWLVPVDPPYDQGLPETFVQVGTTALRAHPSLWVHELLDPGLSDVIGYLILSAGDPDSVALFEATAAALTPLGPLGPDAIYKGFRPGEEHWIWLDQPWPASFALRGLEYAVTLPAPVTEGERFAYPIDQFASAGGPAALEGRTYRIRTDPGAPAVGYLAIDGQDTQRWAARPKALYQGLIPPFKDGTWRFDEVSAASTVGMVPLSRGELARIDLSDRG